MNNCVTFLAFLNQRNRVPDCYDKTKLFIFFCCCELYLKRHYNISLTFGCIVSTKIINHMNLYIYYFYWTYLVAQMVKNLPAVWETWVRSLGWEDPLEKEMATHSSTLAWENPMDRGAFWATVHGIIKSWT